MCGGDDVAFNKERALEVLQEELYKKGLMRQVPGKHMHRLMVLYVEFLGREERMRDERQRSQWFTN